MRLVSTLSIWLIASLATAVDSDATNATCTNTLTESAKCCVAPAYYTETSYTDCAGCALATKTTGPNCDIVRTSPLPQSCPPTSPFLDTQSTAHTNNFPPNQVRCALPTPIPNTTPTVTACSASPTCTSVVTATAPFGCTITVPARTQTEMIDCKGCTLSTTTVINRLFGLGPECVGGRKTVQGGTGVARATACLAEE